MALSTAARRAIAIRNSIKRRQAAPAPKPSRLLSECLAAAGFDQHAAYGC